MGEATTVKPDDIHGWPGYEVFEMMTKEQWHRTLVNFALKIGFEFIDMQADITMCVALFMDKAYREVAFRIKVAFITITVLSFLLEFCITLSQASQIPVAETLSGFSKLKARINICILNYFAA